MLFRSQLPIGFGDHALAYGQRDEGPVLQVGEQSVGKGIDIYTHGEMLPTHGYPKLKKYPHFYGHYGTAWQNQQKEILVFFGVIFFTTNCLQKPGADYTNRLFCPAPAYAWAVW